MLSNAAPVRWARRCNALTPSRSGLGVVWSAISESACSIWYQATLHNRFEMLDMLLQPQRQVHAKSAVSVGNAPLVAIHIAPRYDRIVFRQPLDIFAGVAGRSTTARGDRSLWQALTALALCWAPLSCDMTAATAGASIFVARGLPLCIPVSYRLFNGPSRRERFTNSVRITVGMRCSIWHLWPYDVIEAGRRSIRAVDGDDATFSPDSDG